MNRYFFRYFISIFSVALLILGVQTAILFFGYRAGEKHWRNQAYEDFVSFVEQRVSENGTSDLKPEFVKGFPDDRIDGFDFNTRPEGLPEPGNREVRETILDFSSSGSGAVLSGRTEGSVSIPGGDDAFGRVTVRVNSDRAFSVDLRIMSPMKYERSADILRTCLRSLVISVPVCLVLALLLAYLISRRNTDDVNKIRKALQELADGKYDVKLDVRGKTEITQMVASVDELAKSLEAAKRSRNAWLNSISHDLNTPAASIKVIVEGIRDGVFPADDKTLYALGCEVDDLVKRIQQVIDYSTLRGESSVVKKELAAAAFARDVVVSCSDPSRVSADVYAEKIYCDEVRMKRACLELLENALKAQPEGSVGLQILQEDEHDVIRVVNSGKLPASLEGGSAFEPWTRGDKARSEGGSGLGLAIVGTVARLHGGKAVLGQEKEVVEAEISWPLLIK